MLGNHLTDFNILLYFTTEVVELFRSNFIATEIYG